MAAPLARQLAGPHKSSIARARARLGPAPLRALFVEVARPLATRKTKGAWYRGWRLVALDGTTLDVPDTPANVAAFGWPGGSRVGLVECGTHAVLARPWVGCTWGSARSHRRLALARPRDAAAGRPGPVQPGALAHLPGDGAELVWRCRQDVKLPVLAVFANGPGQAS